MTKYELVVQLAEQALEKLSEANPGEKPSGREILKWIEENRPDDVESVKNSFGSYLTKAASDSSSRIIREPGKYGFTLKPGGPAVISNEKVDNNDPSEGSTVKIDALQPDAAAYEVDVLGLGGIAPTTFEAEAISSRQKRESKLYNLLIEWLASRDLKARDASNSKKGGQWGNPDVVGVELHETLGGGWNVELTSVEAKTSDRSWRQLLFEAVSHKRFADRVYFAFASPSEEPIVSSLTDYWDLREYGERFRVGILAVFINPEDYKKLIEGDSSDLDLALEDVRVEEVWPAVRDPVAPSIRDSFMRDVLGLSSLKDLFEFDEVMDD